MKKKAKTVIGLLLALTLAVSLIPAAAFAAETGTEAFSGKKVSILGDSISSFAGVSNNTAYNATIGGNATYYPNSVSLTCNETWWQQVIDALGMELCVNNSWSGSHLAAVNASGAPAAYVDRCVQLHNTKGDTPDYIWVYLGTNDYTGQNGSKYLPWGTAAAVNKDALITKNADNSYTYATPTTVCEAYAIMLHKAMQRYPDAQILCLGLLTRANDTIGRMSQCNDEMEALVKSMGATYVDLEDITDTASEQSLYLANQLHPNAKGMDQISQRVISAMLGKDTAVYGVSYSLSGVTASTDAALVCQGGKYETTLTADSGLEVTVTMGGTDVTADVYKDGKISVASVTGDIVITAKAVYQPRNYRWELNAAKDGLVNVTTDDFAANALTKVSGSVSSGVQTGTAYSMAKAVTLLPTNEWTVEWKMSGTDSNGTLILSASSGAISAGQQYLYHRSPSSFLAFGQYGQYASNQWNNYGVTGLTASAAATVYRIENRVNADGTNMAYLFINGTEVGPMSTKITGNTPSTAVDNSLNGKALTFQAIGSTTSTFELDGLTLEYLEICEDTQPQDTKNEDNYRWELNAAKDGLVNVTSDVFAANAISKTKGSIANGVHTGTVHTMEKAVTLLPTDEWVIQWKVTGDDDNGGNMLLASAANVQVSGSQYIYHRPNGHFLGFGSYTGGYINYGVQNFAVDETGVQVYRIENRVNADGTNMAYLLRNGVEIGAMNLKNNNGTNTAEVNNWVSGKTFTFQAIGSSTSKFALEEVNLEYLEIYTVKDAHTCEYLFEVDGSRTASNCTTAGSVTMRCGCGATKAVPLELDDDAHTWGAAAYEWNAGNTACTAKRVCANNAAHVETETVTAASQVTTQADCQTAEVVTYSADFTVEWAADQAKPVTGEKDMTKHTSTEVTYKNVTGTTHDEYHACCDTLKAAAVAHAYGDANECACGTEKHVCTWGAAAYEWNADNTACTAKRVCTGDASHVETETVTASSQVTTQADCQTAEVVTYSADFTAEWAADQAKPVTGEKDMTKHTSAEVTYKNVTGTTHDEYHACCDTLKAAAVAHAYGDANECACGAKKPANVPATGDNAVPALWGFALVVSAAFVLLLVRKARRAA